MTTRTGLKTEHAGAKNGGGYFGRRVQAKAESRVKRRHDDRAEVEERAGDADTAAAGRGQGADPDPVASAPTKLTAAEEEFVRRLSRMELAKWEREHGPSAQDNASS
jgi:hypothetical protein